MSLVVVDRRAMWRDALRAAVRQEHPRVRLQACKSCNEVEPLLRARPVDAILCEYCVHAVHLQRTIQGWKAMRPATHVVVMSAMAHPRYAAQAAWAGADGYVTCDDELAALSAREFDTLMRLCAGNRPKEIAAALGLSEKTVHEYQRRLGHAHRHDG